MGFVENYGLNRVILHIKSWILSGISKVGFVGNYELSRGGVLSGFLRNPLLKNPLKNLKKSFDE